MMILSPQSLTDVQWWYNKINCSKNNITKGEPVIKFHLMQVVLGGELSGTMFALEEHSTLREL